MAFGAPVVCANAASLPEVVGDAALLFPPGAAAALAAALSRLLDDPALDRRQLFSIGPALTSGISLKASYGLRPLSPK